MVAPSSCVRCDLLPLQKRPWILETHWARDWGKEISYSLSDARITLIGVVGRWPRSQLAQVGELW